MKGTDITLFDRFEVSFWDITDKEQLSKALKSLHEDLNLLTVLETVQDYELTDEVLITNMLGEFRAYVPVMFNYLDVCFKLISGENKDTLVQCLIEEMEGLQVIYANVNTLSTIESPTIVGL